MVCLIEAVGLRPGGWLYKRETTRQIEISVSPHGLVKKAVVLVLTSGHAVVWDHADGSPSTSFGGVHGTVGCNSNNTKCIFLNELYCVYKAVTLNKQEHTLFLDALWLDRMLGHHVYRKSRQGTLVFPH